MKIILICLFIGILLGAVLVIPIHNYEVEKCKFISDNQYYEAKSGCYMILEKPLLNVIAWYFINLLVFGFISLYVGMILEAVYK